MVKTVFILGDEEDDDDDEWDDDDDDDWSDWREEQGPVKEVMTSWLW
jgi:hypothetical protein